MQDREMVNMLKDAKNICKRLRRFKKLSIVNMDKLFEKDIYRLGEIYEECDKKKKKDLKYIKLMSEIEHGLYIMLRGNNRELDFKILKGYQKDISYKSNNNFVIMYLKFINRKTLSLNLRYIKILKLMEKMNNKNVKFTTYYIFLRHIMNGREQDYVNEIVCSDSFKKNLQSIIDKTYDIERSRFALANMVVSVKAYYDIASIRMYQDECIEDIEKYENIASASFEAIGKRYFLRELVMTKIASFCKKNIIDRDIKKANRYGFEYRIVQNTILVKSKVDNWYINIDKENGICDLYHGNDCDTENYHYQKSFNKLKLCRVFRYIDEHDAYSLFGSVKNRKKALSR